MHLEFYETKTQPRHSISLVFVHGAWAGKWYWLDNFVPYFESFGYRCIAMDLRGHGGSEGIKQINKYRISDYVTDIQSIVEKIGGKIVLIGHSMGGAAVEKYIQEYPVAGAVLIASVPANGGAAFASRLSKKLGNRKMFKLFVTKNMLLAINDPKITKSVFFSEAMPEEEFEKHFERLGNESYAASMEIRKAIITAEPNPQKVPILVIGARQDGCFPPEEVEANAEIYGVKPVFVDGGHTVMLDRCWKEAAENIRKWLALQEI